jgi:hypothetical protein
MTIRRRLLNASFVVVSKREGIEHELNEEVLAEAGESSESE